MHAFQALHGIMVLIGTLALYILSYIESTSIYIYIYIYIYIAQGK